MLYFVLTIVLVIIGFVLIYNRLIAQKNEINNAEGMVDAVLKKRYDLIPNLVTTVKKYMEYEKETLLKVTQLRTEAINATNIQDKMEINNEISKILKGIVVSVEQYPELKSSQNMLQLQQALAETEGHICAARRTYNQAVTDFNNACEQIPSNFVAKMLNYKRQPVLSIPETEAANVNINDMFQN